ncbi:MAG: ADP-ribosylglycohydrolase family protein [Ilumatobacteraceae bacterium]
MDKYAIRNKALGAVIGSAVGDALGAPFEFGEPGEYSDRFPKPVVGDIGEMIGGRGWKPGEFTDDTQMALAQAESLLAHHGIDEADMFQRFQIWASRAADVGNQTRAVLGSGLPWETAAADHFERTPRGAAGNGSLMRSAASAVFFSRGTLEESMEAAHRLSALTHGDPAAGWGTAIYHAMIHAELNGDRALDVLPSVLTGLPDDQFRFREMLSPTWKPSDSDLSNGTVWTCLAQAVWAVRGATNFEGAVVRAIDLGHDTDTVAAVAGGLAGAIHGIQRIPSRWTTYINGRVQHADGEHRYRLADLQNLTLSLIGNGAKPEERPAAAVGPTEIVDGVYAANLEGAADVPTDWAVISLCRVGDRFHDHPMRRELYLVDDSAGQNGALHAAVEDAAESIDAFRAEGRKVVVHCHMGASRTGLVLRAWLVRHDAMTTDEATSFVADRWSLLDSTTNTSFAAFLRDDWAPR